MILEIPGILQLPTDPAGEELAVQQWSSCFVNSILMVVATVLFIALLGDLIRMFPVLLDCAGRWKGNVSVQQSVSLSRERNTIALYCLLPFCILVDRYGLYKPDFLAEVPAELSAATILCVLISYLLIRRVSYWRIGRRLRMETSRSALHTLFNIFILTTCLGAICALGMEAFRASDSAIKAVLYVVILLGFLLSVVRTGQILKFHCSGFVTFLYLCALEFIPATLLILSATVV